MLKWNTSRVVALNGFSLASFLMGLLPQGVTIKLCGKVLYTGTAVLWLLSVFCLATKFAVPHHIACLLFSIEFICVQDTISCMLNFQ